jgi:hypothetical protein
LIARPEATTAMATEPASRNPFVRRAFGRLRRGLGAVRKSRWARAARLGSSLIVAAYALLIAYPGVLFAHEVSHGAFRFYSDEPIDPAIVAILDDAAARLARSTLNDPAMIHRLYVCNTRLRWTLLAPRHRGAFGVTYARLIRGNSILNRADIPGNLIFRDAGRNHRRPLSSVIAHERTHALMDRRYGPIACVRMPEWKREGYCEYIGGHPSLGIEEGKGLIREGHQDLSGPFRYFRAYAMVTYLLDVDGLSIDEVVARDFDEPALLAKVRAAIDELKL